MAPFLVTASCKDRSTVSLKPCLQGLVDALPVRACSGRARRGARSGSPHDQVPGARLPLGLLRAEARSGDRLSPNFLPQRARARTTAGMSSGRARRRATRPRMRSGTTNTIARTKASTRSTVSRYCTAPVWVISLASSLVWGVCRPGPLHGTPGLRVTRLKFLLQPPDRYRKLVGLSSRAVHRAVDNLCRNAAVAVGNLGMALWTLVDQRHERGHYLRNPQALVVRRKKCSLRTSSTMAASYAHSGFHVLRKM
jgi:hypothetical protein